jgi:hypothetical protein
MTTAGSPMSWDRAVSSACEVSSFPAWDFRIVLTGDYLFRRTTASELILRAILSNSSCQVGYVTCIYYNRLCTIFCIKYVGKQFSGSVTFGLL